MPDQTKFHEFDAQAVNDAMAAVQSFEDDGGAAAAFSAAGAQKNISFADSGEMFLAAQCISVTVQGGKICLNLPFAGKVCLPIPKFVPNGKVVEACFGLCYIWKIPKGVKVTVSFGGKVILTKIFGKC